MARIIDNISNILLELCPKAKFIIESNDYDKLNWLDTRDKPTYAEVVSHKLTTEIRETRKNLYPEIGDQLDSISKLVKYLKDNNIDVGPDGEAWISQINQIKSENPLP